MGGPDRVLREGFEYQFSPVDPVAGAHIDPVGTAVYETLVVKGPGGKRSRRWPRAGRFRPTGSNTASGCARGCASIPAPPATRGGDGGARTLPLGDVRTRQIQYWDPVATVAAEDERTVLIRAHYPTTR